MAVEKTKYVARGVIQIVPEDLGEVMYPLGQRRIDGNREMRGYWECFGGSLSADDAAHLCTETQLHHILRNTVKRELMEELPGIQIVEVAELVHTHRRKYMFLPQESRSDKEDYDYYESAHFLVRAVLPNRITVDETEHCGFGLFTMKQVLSLDPMVRQCTLDAIVNAHKLRGSAFPVNVR